jgi:pimeloyl-ACP methyl ester carboxylesterase
MDFHILNDDNLKIRYAVGGSKGEIVLLIHGLGGSIESWVNNIVHFQRNSRSSPSISQALVSVISLSLIILFPSTRTALQNS